VCGTLLVCLIETTETRPLIPASAVPHSSVDLQVPDIGSTSQFLSCLELGTRVGSRGLLIYVWPSYYLPTRVPLGSWTVVGLK